MVMTATPSITCGWLRYGADCAKTRGEALPDFPALMTQPPPAYRLGDMQIGWVSSRSIFPSFGKTGPLRFPVFVQWLKADFLAKALETATAIRIHDIRGGMAVFCGERV
jgi:hypothetical protein